MTESNNDVNQVRRTARGSILDAEQHFIGTSENAVKIQIIIAMIAYLLLGIARKLMPTKRSLQQLARLVSVNLMQRRNIVELLGSNSSPPKRKPAVNSRQLALINA